MLWGFCELPFLVTANQRFSHLRAAQSAKTFKHIIAYPFDKDVIGGARFALRRLGLPLPDDGEYDYTTTLKCIEIDR